MSSAYLIIVAEVLFSVSTYSSQYIGPIRVPCGVPFLTGNELLFMLPSLTCCDLSLRKLFTIATKLLFLQRSASMVSSFDLSMRSNAFDISKNSAGTLCVFWSSVVNQVVLLVLVIRVLLDDTPLVVLWLSCYWCWCCFLNKVTS